MSETKESIKNRFDQMVKRNEKIYLCKAPEIILYLKSIKQQAKIDNKGVIPFVEFHSEGIIYKCDTCGTVNKSHPITSYCFVCDTDNWRQVKQ